MEAPETGDGISGGSTGAIDSTIHIFLDGELRFRRGFHSQSTGPCIGMTNGGHFWKGDVKKTKTAVVRAPTEVKEACHPE